MCYRRRKKDDLIPFKDVKAMASKTGIIDEQEVRKRKGGLVLGLWSLTPLTMIFQFYWSTRRKPPTCHKSLTNFIT
jgi:hypothetical protein